MKILLFAFAALPLSAARSTVSLDGEWMVAESKSAAPPDTSAYTRRAPVPGLANLAQPALPDVDQFDSREFIAVSIREKRLPESARVTVAGVTRQQRDYLWFRRTFRAPAATPAAILKVGKAQFGTAVWLNGAKVGEHLGCFTAGFFDLRGGIKPGAENELVIRIGAHPNMVPVWAPAGTDFEKYKWTPGIYDSVSVAFSGLPVIEAVQVAPRPAKSSATVQTQLYNPGNTPVEFTLRHTVGNATAGGAFTLNARERRMLVHSIAIPNAHLWTPEDPFLYTVNTTAGGDSVATRFGMREFRFDTATKRAYLNGKLYFLRGSNITLHRFFEDPQCKRLPWDRAWVRKLLVDHSKRMNWNSYRFCIGPVPDMWLDIADEAGLLVQNEFFIWNGREYFPPYKTEELLAQYAEWIRDNANHPSVAIWDSNNETDAPILRDVVIPAMRKLDLSNRPWENGYGIPSGYDDPVEDHPYVFNNVYSGRDFQMVNLEKMTGAKTTNAGHPSGHAVIANEYGWLWLNRDGSPTRLTEKVYEYLLGPSSTAQQRFELYAYYLAGLTEFWRAHRNFAGVLHFTTLTCSYPGVKTSDHFRDVTRLEMEPNFADWVRESFKPLGLYINFWQPTLKPAESRVFPVMMVNDEPRPIAGKLTVRFEPGGHKTEQPFELPAYGQHTWNVTLAAPAQAGTYLLRAEALEAGKTEPTLSRRKVEVR
ncbi:MAG: hypothetical protein IT168_20015 [Bryobacterales bacterium]|nr:hypothetical protein [Bryobacterales bacterium]